MKKITDYRTVVVHDQFTGNKGLLGQQLAFGGNKAGGEGEGKPFSWEGWQPWGNPVAIPAWGDHPPMVVQALVKYGD